MFFSRVRAFVAPILVLALLLNAQTVLIAQSTSKKPKKSARRSGHRASPARIKKMSQAFVASSDLRPMALQLVEARTSAAYAGVQKYADSHAGTQAGAFAWLVIGYAHTLDNEFDKAVPAFLNARGKTGELEDYVDFLLGSSQAALHKPGDVVEALSGFEKRNPDSLYRREAAVLLASALTENGDAPAAIELLMPYRGATRADVELALGRAFVKNNETGRAIECFTRIYLTLPLTPEAFEANAELNQLAKKESLPPFSIVQRRERAERLMQGRRYAEAVDEYRSILNDPKLPKDEVPASQIALGEAYYRDKRNRDARATLQKAQGLEGELAAKRTYFLIELARSDEGDMLKLLSELKAKSPQSPWLEESLLTMGNVYLLRKDWDKASKYYSELVDRFPAGKYSAYANWKAAWLQLRMGNTEEAKRSFERHIALFPASAEAGGAVYWRGRLAEEDNNLAKARAYYTKAAERYRNSYYALLSRQRLLTLPPGEASVEPLLRKIPLPAPAPRFRLTAPADNLRVEKSLLLQNCGLLDFAIRELQAAGDDDGVNWQLAQIIRIYSLHGNYSRTLQSLKKNLPGYFSYLPTEVPRAFWEGLFPRVYWDDLKKDSESQQLDPFLVASIIRQESEFNATAVSRAGAVGLMQILPGTGQKLAKEMKLKNFTRDQLADPAVNLVLGTKYFRQLLQEQGGVLEYTLAAYNAGPDRVAEWRKDGKYRDIYEFVESIPFTETREYVQAIVRNVNMYKTLYNTP